MLTHRVAYNPHIHVAKNFVALVDALLAATPTVPYSKTLIDDKQIDPPVIRPAAAARETVLARVRQLTGRCSPNTGRPFLYVRSSSPHYAIGGAAAIFDRLRRGRRCCSGPY